MRWRIVAWFRVLATGEGCQDQKQRGYFNHWLYRRFVRRRTKVDEIAAPAAKVSSNRPIQSARKNPSSAICVSIMFTPV